jgi:polyisoprenoid-binding protein YceI
MKTLCLFLLSLLLLSGSEHKLKSGCVSFKIKNAGMSVEGTLTGMEATIVFDPQKPQEAKISASVLASTINTGNNTRDGHLRKSDYFDAVKYPKITMVSTKIEKTGIINYNGYFKLTMKGITKDVIVPFLYMKTPEGTKLKGSFTLNRLDYNIGSSSFTLSDNVTVNILAEIAE